MRKGLLILTLACLAVIPAVLPKAGAGTVQVNVNLAPLGRSFSPPPLARNQGWLTVSNRDWTNYSLVVQGNNRLFLYRAGDGFGGTIIPSGATVTIALQKATYDLYGNHPEKLRTRIREGRTTTLSLEPFGFVGQTGLIGVVNDGDRVRNGTLFDIHVAPVVVAPPPPPGGGVRPPPPPPPPPP
ncbi:MAG: hypothetical protein FWG74_04540, partial [Planctomycetes bacterium]|nr:hypothetical protein [Planctomycetota bacterium]